MVVLLTTVASNIYGLKNIFGSFAYESERLRF